MPKTCEFDLNRRRFRMQELRDVDEERLDEYVQGRFIAAARSSLAEEPVGSDAWRETMSVAMETAAGMRWKRQPGIRYLISTRRALARLLWQGCVQLEPSITVDDIAACLVTAQDVQTAHEEFRRVNGLDLGPPSTNGKKREAANGSENPTSSASPSYDGYQVTPLTASLE